MSEQSLSLGSGTSSSSLHDDMEETVHVKKKLGVLVSSVFIIGAMCGSGVLAIPQAIVDCGNIGFVMVIICGVLSAYTGGVLGECWTILRIRYPEYTRQRITDPYPIIAYRAGGKIAAYATRFCIDATLFGGATVFLLLIAGNISELMKELGNIHFSLCYLAMIVFGVLAPLTWLGTPKDFWQAGIVAAVTSIVAAVLIFANLLKEIPNHKNPEHNSPTFASFFNAFGTILFAFGGASCFPTIQVDMEEPNKFPKSVVIGIGTVLSVYLLVGVTGFAVLGDAMEPNVINALPAGWISYTVNILITSHLFMAYVIISNPINQELEGFFNIPDEFCLKRIISRTSLAAAIMLVALTIPHFSVILSLIGGSTIALTNFIFPPLFYLLLSRQLTPSAAHGPLPSYVINDNDVTYDGIRAVDSALYSFPNILSKNPQDGGRWQLVYIPLHVRVLLMEIIAIGTVGGISSTYFSILSLANGDSGFTVPCYVDPGVGL